VNELPSTTNSELFNIVFQNYAQWQSGNVENMQVSLRLHLRSVKCGTRGKNI